ncbi:MAG: hypothetical protein M3Y26_11855, partial [Actinomycetota bacterium]|nr:hypothetical protein [Actinomycetota bacterium]
MGSAYAGANSFPASVLCPDDGDPENASSVNVPMQGLADRTAWLRASLSERIDTLTAASGTWTCPDGVTSIELQCVAAGGGGAGGCASLTSGSGTVGAFGGGGGGGGRKSITRRVVVPGTVYPYVNGAPGTAGAGAASGGASGGLGGDAADSSFNGVVCGRGGGGGGSATIYTSAAGRFPVTQGGKSPRSVTGPFLNYKLYQDAQANAFFGNADANNGGEGGNYFGQRAQDGGCSQE